MTTSDDLAGRLNFMELGADAQQQLAEQGAVSIRPLLTQIECLHQPVSAFRTRAGNRIPASVDISAQGSRAA